MAMLLAHALGEHGWGAEPGQVKQVGEYARYLLTVFQAERIEPGVVPRLPMSSA